MRAHDPGSIVECVIVEWHIGYWIAVQKGQAGYWLHCGPYNLPVPQVPVALLREVQVLLVPPLLLPIPLPLAVCLLLVLPLLHLRKKML